MATTLHTYAIDITDSKLSARFVVAAHSKPTAFAAVAHAASAVEREGPYGPAFYTTAHLGETMEIAFIGGADELDSYRESADRRNRATFLGAGLSLAHVSEVRNTPEGPEVSLYGDNDEVIGSMVVGEDEHRDFAEEAYNRQLLREM